MIIEILKVFFGTIWAVFSEVITCLWALLPLFLEIRKMASVLTPVGMIALYLGVPTCLVSAVIFLIKRVLHT
ncbi:MAG: hypothetical protein IJW55_06515 [Clostridia bacterium]|nr:hypothetical protein [Clostridia bacterium]